MVLGADYELETALYEDLDKNIYLKLSGDVLLTQDNLNKLISKLKNKQINNIYIDDSIFAREKYPASWLEEDKWPNQRMISPYIIDKNFGGNTMGLFDTLKRQAEQAARSATAQAGQNLV
jgi:D-alanyl-D-alanine carboxypeptidase